MSNKDIVFDLVRRLPDDASLSDIAREIEFIAAVREGFEQLDRGEGVAIEEVEKMLPSWLTK
jgi:predicted transcriptional regulator